MQIIIFSKDRACQLSLLLDSMKKHMSGFGQHSIKILYTTSGYSYKKGYIKLIEMYKYINNISFYEQKDFKNDLISLIDIKDNALMFGVDDDIFIRDFSLNDEVIQEFINKDYTNEICVSLRMHEKITYCYTENKTYPVAPYFYINGGLVWNWTMPKGGDACYPLSLDFHLFKTKVILPLIKNIEFTSPNTLEGRLATHYSKILNYALMASYKEARIINLAINKVQNDNTNRHGNISNGTLNELFLTDRMNVIKIDYDLLKSCNACHTDQGFYYEL